jgi:hypothetical protein
MPSYDIKGSIREGAPKRTTSYLLDRSFHLGKFVKADNTEGYTRLMVRVPEPSSAQHRTGIMLALSNPMGRVFTMIDIIAFQELIDGLYDLLVRDSFGESLAKQQLILDELITIDKETAQKIDQIKNKLPF